MQSIGTPSIFDRGESSLCPCHSYAFSTSTEHAFVLLCGHHPACPHLAGYRPDPASLLDGLLVVIEWLDKEVIRLGGNPYQVRRQAVAGFSCCDEEEKPTLIYNEPLTASFEVLLDDDTEEDIHG